MGHVKHTSGEGQYDAARCYYLDKPDDGGRHDVATPLLVDGEMDRPSRFGALLKRHRVSVGLTQEALAERALLSPRGIQDLERGVNQRPRQDTIERLVAALGLDASDRAAFERAARAPASSMHPHEGGGRGWGHASPSRRELPRG
jgi:DNA-binding XRE family transcriptional regulator